MDSEYYREMEYLAHEDKELPWSDADYVDLDREQMAERGAYDDTMERWVEVDR